MTFLDKPSANTFLNYVYSHNKLFRYVNKVEGTLLGIKIKEIRPKTKKEWEDYLNKHNIVEQFAKTMMKNCQLAEFRRYSHFVDILDYEKVIIPWCKKLLINHQFKGYQNELIAEKFCVERGFTCFPTNYQDDVNNSLDFHIVKDRLRGGVSVKSQGFYYLPIRHKETLFKKLESTQKKMNLHFVFLLIVDNDGNVDVFRTWPAKRDK